MPKYYVCKEQWWSVMADNDQDAIEQVAEHGWKPQDERYYASKSST